MILQETSIFKEDEVITIIVGVGLNRALIPLMIAVLFLTLISFQPLRISATGQPLVVTTHENLMASASSSDVTQSNSFSLIQITDTQHLSSTYPSLYSLLTEWIANNSVLLNLQMVIHTGDIVNQYSNRTQWQNANTSMSILSANGIPYVWCAGNHDQNYYSNPDTGWIGNQYSAFNASTFSNSPFWVGDNNQGKSTAAQFAYGDYRFLIVDLESLANSTTMTWFTNLMDTYSAQNYNIMVGTHAYLSSPNSDFDNGLGNGTWEINLQNLLKNYTNVFLTLNGHTETHPEVSVRNQVNSRTQIEFNRQQADNLKGACSVRIYTFNLDSASVTTSTYNVWNATWLTNPLNNFNFTTNLISTPLPTPTPMLNSPSPTSPPAQTQTFTYTSTPKPKQNPTHTPTPTPKTPTKSTDTPSPTTEATTPSFTPTPKINDTPEPIFVVLPLVMVLSVVLTMRLKLKKQMFKRVGKK